MEMLLWDSQVLDLAVELIQDCWKCVPLVFAQLLEVRMVLGYELGLSPGVSVGS